MSADTVFFTICSNNYLAQAEVFFASVRRHHPEVALVLGLADEPDEQLRYPEGVEVMPAAGLAIPDFLCFAFAYNVMEFNTAIKPFLMLRLLERGYRNVVFFDPDIEIHRRLDEVTARLAGGASFVLTPHFINPPDPEGPRTEQHVMQTGVYNLGFIAAAQRPETEPLLRWWARKLLHDCVDRQDIGLFVDQKYMDLLPGLAAHAHVLRDTSYNVAYWNLPRRVVTGAPDGTLLVDGRPLAFFHFSGFSPDRPAELSVYARQAQIGEALAALLGRYAERRREAAQTRVGSRPYAYGTFRSGVSVPALVRRMFREKHRTWSGDPFAAYDRYSRLPHPGARAGTAGEIVTNLMQHHHASDSALRFAFRLDNPFEVTAYARLFNRIAASLGIDDSLWKVIS